MIRIVRILTGRTEGEQNVDNIHTPMKFENNRPEAGPNQGRRSLTHCVALGAASALMAWASFGPVRAEAPAKPAGQKGLSTAPVTGLMEERNEKLSGAEFKLNYFQAPWKKVLSDFARETGTTLEAERFPATKYSRRDWRTHTTDQALTVLNRELSTQGFLLSIRGDKLVLEEKSKLRHEYARQEIKPANERNEDPKQRPADSKASASLAKSADKNASRTQVHQIQTTDESDESSRIMPASNREEASSRSAVRQPREMPRLERDLLQADAEPESVASPRPKARRDEVVRAVPMEVNRATIVGRIIHDAFGGSSALVDDGPEGLQGFRVQRASGKTPTVAARGNSAKKSSPATTPEIQFAVGIDREANELVVQAESKLVKQIVRLIETVDASPISSQQAVRAVATTKDAAQVAKVLQPQLDRLAQAERLTSRNVQRIAQAGRAGKTADAEDEPKVSPARSTKKALPRSADEAEQKPTGEEDQPKKSDIPSLISNLKGDVSVEAMPDLGVLIIKGNQRDVDAVMAVIREIERLSAGTAPDVHLLLLKHVSSEGLASLLNGIYDRMGTIRSRTVAQTQAVSVIPIVRPNAILILASANDMEAVLNLADELDQPTDPQMEFEVFSLKHAVATEVANTLEQMYPAPAAQTGQQQRIDAGLAPRIRVTTDTRTNSVIVQARPRDLVEVAALINKLDRDESGAVNQIRIFPLRSATANELATTLQNAIETISSTGGPAAAAARRTTGGSGQGGQGQGGGGGGSTSKSAVLQFLTIDGDRERIVRSGILDDINVSPDQRTNSLVVTAPEQSMELIAELIEQLDRPAASVAEIKVFTLKNGDATQAIQLLEKLFPPPTQQGQGLGGQQGQQQTQAVGILVAGADDAGSGLIPLRFSVDPRTNSILAIGGAEALRVVQAILLRLDASDIRQREYNVYRLKNSPAADVANAINTFLQSQRQVITQADPNLYSPFEQIDREVVVVAEPVSNSLLISATPRFFEEIKEIVTRLDMAPAQVIIQALIVEVTLDSTDEFGVELGFQDPVLFSRQIFPASNITTLSTTNTTGQLQTTTQNVISQYGTPGFSFNNQPLGGNIQGNPGKVGTQGLGSFALGRVNSDLGYGGLVLSASSDAVSVLLRALAQRRRVDILSRPQIRTLDNQTAQIQVGQTVPVVNGLNTSIAGVVNPLVQRAQAGIILTVTPRVTPDKMVVMEVIAEKSLFLKEGVPLYTDSTGRTIESPKQDITTARTTVSVRNNQTAVMGGMITKNSVSEERKVPFFGDIPILGQAFRYDYYSNKRTELLIFLTPRLIANDEDSEMIKQIEMDRINFIECEAEQMHGPLRGISSQLNWNAPDGGQPAVPPLLPTTPDGVQTPPPEPADFSAPTTTLPPPHSKSKPEPKTKSVGPTMFPKSKP